MRAVYERRRTIPEAAPVAKQSVHVRATEGKSRPKRLGPSTVSEWAAKWAGRAAGVPVRRRSGDERELQGRVHLDRRDGTDRPPPIEDEDPRRWQRAADLGLR